MSQYFLLLYVKPGAGLFALHCGDGDPSSRVVVDHPRILIPKKHVVVVVVVIVVVVVVIVT